MSDRAVVPGCTIEGVARSAGQTQRLEVGPDVAAVLRPEEAMRLHDIRDIERLRCHVCGEWIEPASSSRTSVSVSIDGDDVTVDFAHADCSPSRADLAPLTVIAQAEPLGIAYAQALHPEAGAVLLWERKLDLRVRGTGAHNQRLYLDRDWWEGFHPAIGQEPVRLLVGWLLRSDGTDLLLLHHGSEVEHFHNAVERAPAGWMQALEDSGFCLLIVGAGIGLDRPGADAIQRAIREHRALMGLAEFDL
ncbi:MAG TPA: hypothetical protein VG325_06430 [Solirubrobacteraceae bacterium]|jgi:hypothetical protein|nr:hypothetical protein [Solirubrobacteraceae bacterium]